MSEVITTQLKLGLDTTEERKRLMKEMVKSVGKLSRNFDDVTIRMEITVLNTDTREKETYLFEFIRGED